MNATIAGAMVAVLYHDEGRPLEVGLQAQTSNRGKRRRSRVVVSVVERPNKGVGSLLTVVASYRFSGGMALSSAANSA